VSKSVVRCFYSFQSAISNLHDQMRRRRQILTVGDTCVAALVASLFMAHHELATSVEHRWQLAHRLPLSAALVERGKKFHQLLRVQHLSPPQLYLSPFVGDSVRISNWRFSPLKTRIVVLICGERTSTKRLAVLTPCRIVTDKRTD